MKQKRLLFVAIGIMAVVLANAATWRINPNPSAKAKFTSIEQAMNDQNVAQGDTLMLDPGAYGDFELTKENITVIGPGYFLDQKKGWYEMDMVIIKHATLSKWSTIEGCSATNIVAAEGATIRRCKINEILNSESDPTNYVVEQCFVTSVIEINSYCNIRNNIILGYIVGNGDGIVIENNTMVNDKSSSCLAIDNITNSIARNNILLNQVHNGPGMIYRFQGTGLSIYNNVTNRNQADNYVYDKITDASVESLFQTDSSIDGRWQLLENSPAKGAGANGEDCGAFAGNNPYILSGLPRFIPHITKVEVPSRPTNGKLNIKIKIENQDE